MRVLARWTGREVENIIHSVLRYTRFVRSTKLTLAILVLVLSGTVLFYSLRRGEDSGIRIDFSSVEKGVSTPTQMNNARFHGLDKDNQPFNVNAVTASQRDADTLDLTTITGDIALNSGIWFSMSSNTGVFSMKARTLDLSGAIDMMNDQGYEFRTETLHIDLGKKMAVTHRAVRGQGTMGTLHATGATFNGNTQVINFDGPIRMKLYPAH